MAKQGDGDATPTSVSAGMAQAAPTPSSRFPVEHWERYEFLKQLGEGGMGTVYQARDRRLGRTVALKFIRGSDQQLIRRFLQEARAQSRIDHPGICKVYEVGEVTGKPYIAMQLIDGRLLTQAAQSMSVADKVAVIKSAAEAMHAAHELGVIHRDLKPGNIMVEVHGGANGQAEYRPVVMDFGLARGAGDGQALTVSGAVMGTVAYMSPEQARGDVRHMDRRTDIYSLGATLYDLLAGQPPFDEEGTIDAILKLITDNPPRLRERLPDTPEALDSIVGKCLQKEPERRYATAQELAADLGRFLVNQQVVGQHASRLQRLRSYTSRHKPLVALGITLLVGVLVLAGYGVRSHTETRRKERQAWQEAALLQKASQAVKDVDLLVRVAYFMPPHDIGREKTLLRQRLGATERDLRRAGAFGTRLGHYVLGRGHLALQEWDPALAELNEAKRLGVNDPELTLALGRVLGELYQSALAEARQSPVPSRLEARRQELVQQRLVPALDYLTAVPAEQSESPEYVQGLIALYQRQYDRALKSTGQVLRHQPWMYEADRLAADAHRELGHELVQRSDYLAARKEYEQAAASYQRAAEMARSNPALLLYEAATWRDIMRLDVRTGAGPEQAAARGLLVCERALALDPTSAAPSLTQAYLHMGLADWQSRRSGDPSPHLLAAQAAAERVLSQRPDDHWARELLTEALGQSADWQTSQGRLPDAMRLRAIESGERGLILTPNNAQLRTLVSRSYQTRGIWLADHGQAAQQMFDQALARAQRVLAEEPENQEALALSLGTYLRLGQLELSHGRTPLAYLGKAGELAEAELRIDPNAWRLYSALAGIEIIRAQYLIQSGAAASAARAAGLAATAQAQRASPSSADVYWQEADLHALAAWEALLLGQDPGAAIEQGRRAMEHASALAKPLPREGKEGWHLALDLLRVRLLLHQRGAVDAVLTGGLKRALGLLNPPPEHPQPYLLVAELYEARAQSLLQQGKPALGALADALHAVEQALSINPQNADCLAVQGRLQLTSAQAQRDPVVRRRLAAQAASTLDRALKENPLLHREYDPLLTAARGR